MMQTTMKHRPAAVGRLEGQQLVPISRHVERSILAGLNRASHAAHRSLWYDAGGGVNWLKSPIGSPCSR